LYFDGVVFDEYELMSPRIFSEIIRPAVSDRKGWCDFVGTPKGHNHFYDLRCQAISTPDDWGVHSYKVSETKIIDDEELASLRKMMSEDEYNQEYECSYDAAIQGSYYGKELAAAANEGRICNVPHDKAYPVDTYWDLGIRDSTAIWFIQCVRTEIRVIDAYEMDGAGLLHYVGVLDEKRQKLGYHYGTHVGPHDLSRRELGTGKSIVDTARTLGIDFDVAPKLGRDDGIHAVSMILGKCWFDKTKCAYGLDALRNYHRNFNDKRKIYDNEPDHDWSSHMADAFRTFAVSPQIYHDLYAPAKKGEVFSERDPFNEEVFA
jgi:hypothetical protein